MAEITKFLIVDSEPKQSEIYSSFIREVAHNVEIHLCSTSEGALEKLAANVYHSVIYDLSIAKDSQATIERIKASNPDTSIIVTSGEASINEAVRMMKLGAEDYFPKPVNPDQFRLSVRRSIDKRNLYQGDGQIVSFMNLINASQIISASLDEQRVFDTVMNYIRRETQCRGLALYRKTGTEWIRVPTSSDADIDVIQVAVEWSNALEKCMEENVTCKMISKTVVAPELLLFHFKTVGEKDCIAVCASPELKFSHEEVFSRFKMLQVQIQLTGKNIGNYLSVRELLYRDDATSLHNARFLSLSLDKAFENQKKSGKKFAVLFVDVDKFKSVNDGHGHLVGTKLLNEIGECLKTDVRTGDTICRYGGDEFVVILNNVELSLAGEIAERIRKRIEERKFIESEGLNIHLTVSIGVAICPDHAQTKSEIVAAADMAMYVAKRSSKNLVYITGTPEKKAA